MNAAELIGSGTLELYALGMLSAEENRGIESEAVRSIEVREELQKIQASLQALAEQQAIAPPESLKRQVVEAIGRVVKERTDSGLPPVLHAASKASDYASWLNDPAVVRPPDAGPMHIVPLHQSEGEGTGVLWLTLGAPEETHTDEIEKFLILEGTCDVEFNGLVHQLVPGSVLTVPLHTPHTIRITSDIPCKILLQRIAA